MGKKGGFSNEDMQPQVLNGTASQFLDSSPDGADTPFKGEGPHTTGTLLHVDLKPKKIYLHLF